MRNTADSFQIWIRRRMIKAPIPLPWKPCYVAPVRRNRRGSKCTTMACLISTMITGMKETARWMHPWTKEVYAPSVTAWKPQLQVVNPSWVPRILHLALCRLWRQLQQFQRTLPALWIRARIVECEFKFVDQFLSLWGTAFVLWNSGWHIVYGRMHLQELFHIVSRIFGKLSLIFRLSTAIQFIIKR